MVEAALPLKSNSSSEVLTSPGVGGTGRECWRPAAPAGRPGAGAGMSAAAWGGASSAAAGGGATPSRVIHAGRLSLRWLAMAAAGVEGSAGSAAVNGAAWVHILHKVFITYITWGCWQPRRVARGAKARLRGVAQMLSSGTTPIVDTTATRKGRAR